MRKTLRIIAVCAAVVSLVATIVLGFIYLEDALTRLKAFKSGFKNRLIIDDEED